ncbi:efflux RND transporter periplasmic adaptor subunit [bacterium]|nr:efflux RND transporter periplasmic adaptor subunit [bacterium]
MKKFLIVVFVIVIIILLGWRVYQEFFLSKEEFTSRRVNAAVAVEIAPIQKAPINDIGYFTGSLLPWSQFTVAPKITGRLKKIYANIGDVVFSNQLIAILDNEEYVQQVERYQAELEVAKANVEEAKSAYEVARREYDRVITLREKKLVSEAGLDVAEAKYKAQNAKYKVAVAQVAQKEASLKEAQVRLSYTKIRISPKEEDKEINSRVVGERFVDVGALLNPSTSIVTILDIDPLKGVIHVIERDYPKVQVGMEATITTDAFPSKTFKGKIVRLAPLLKEASREARVEIEIPNPDHILKPGMFIRAQILFAKRQDAIIVPTSSLVRRETKQGIFLADPSNKTVSFIPVQLGIVNGEMAEIAQPPLSGFVVIMGQHLLEDGSSITIPDEGTEPQSNKKAAMKGRQSKGEKP